METLLQDLRYALRSLARSPGFAMAATLCLALGIGVNTAVFSLVDSILVRPLPIRDPERVLAVHAAQPGQGPERSAIGQGDLLELRERSTTLQAVAGTSRAGFNLAGADGGPERVTGEHVTHDLFALVGARPALGRGFTAAEDAPGGERVVVLGHALWLRRFGGRADALGR